MFAPKLLLPLDIHAQSRKQIHVIPVNWCQTWPSFTENHYSTSTIFLPLLNLRGLLKEKQYRAVQQNRFPSPIHSDFIMPVYQQTRILPARKKTDVEKRTKPQSFNIRSVHTSDSWVQVNTYIRSGTCHASTRGLDVLGPFQGIVRLGQTREQHGF